MKSLCIAALFSIVTAGAALAGGPVVVELFTSQGCAACPPADAILRKLAQRDDVIGLGLHVDYWDYLGWKDEFADPAHTSRQQAYARAGGRSMIFTPQMIVNGRDSVAGARRMELRALIKAHQAAPVLAALRARREGENLEVSLRPLSAGAAGELVVQLVGYSPLRRSAIARGELAGREFDYANVVESWEVIGTWDGRGPVQISVPFAGDLPAVVLVQRDGGYGPILTAARVE